MLSTVILVCLWQFLLKFHFPSDFEWRICSLVTHLDNGSVVWLREQRWVIIGI
jgi:hypothetical protein